MPGPDHRPSVVEHNCPEIIDLVYSSKRDLKDTPIENAGDGWFTDGNSFLDNGERKAGYPVVSLIRTTEAQALPANTSAQRLN